MMRAIGRNDPLIFHTQRVQALVERFDILLPRDSPSRVVWRQEEFGGPVVIVRTKMSAAAADRILRATGQFGNPITCALPRTVPSVGISRFNVPDRLKHFGG